MTHRYCCQEFEAAVEDETFHQDDQWAISGCCGGGCNVVQEMNYCPFCGTEVRILEPAESP